MNEKARDSKNAEDLLLALVGEIDQRQWRIRKAGSWCFYCAADHSLTRCGCPMPESLGCLGQSVCSDCATAHHAIAGHLKQMFAAPRVDRVSSVRAKLFNQIFGAAEELADKAGTPLEQSLHHFIAQADPYEDEKQHFKGTILDAFNRSQFSDFVGLAKELSREKDDELALKLARWFSCAR
jgi:hypothetical protein